MGDLDAEVVQGAYVVYPGATNAQWNPDAAIIRLRWIENGLWFEMAKFGDVDAELIRGAYIFEPGATSGIWYPDVNIVHLRWVRDGIWFEMLMTGGGSGSLVHLDQNGLIALAESIR